MIIRANYKALTLWVQDVDVAANKLHICDRGPLENGAEIKTIHAPRAVDVSADLIDEIVAYVGIAHTGEVETNHLFIKEHGTRAGQALTYADVDSLFRRLRSHTGIAVTPHMLRHTMLTALAEQGWAPELLQERAGHASFQQTYQTYVHPSQEALRAAWEKTQEVVSLTTRSQLEMEFAKDRWDAHNIPGLRYAAHSSHYHIHFAVVPVSFRYLIKEYAK